MTLFELRVGNIIQVDTKLNGLKKMRSITPQLLSEIFNPGAYEFKFSGLDIDDNKLEMLGFSEKVKNPIHEKSIETFLLNSEGPMIYVNKYEPLIDKNFHYYSFMTIGTYGNQDAVIEIMVKYIHEIQNLSLDICKTVLNIEIE